MSGQKKALSGQSLNDRTFCPLFYASRVIQPFTSFKYNWSRLEIIGIREGKKVGEEREKGNQIKNFHYINRS